MSLDATALNSLQFPTVDITDPETLAMPVPPRHSNLVSSALDDSTYEIIGEPTFIASDDEDGNTVSVASTTDEHSSDDLYDTDTEDLDGDELDGDEQEHYDEHEHGQLDEDNTAAESCADSNATIFGTPQVQRDRYPGQPIFTEGYESQTYTRFRELVREYTTRDAPSGLREFDTRYLNVYFNMGSVGLQEPVNIDETIEIWYFGDAKPKPDIVNKVCKTLDRIKAEKSSQGKSLSQSCILSRFSHTASGVNAKVVDYDVKSCTRLSFEPDSSMSEIIDADVGKVRVSFDCVGHRILPSTQLGPDLAIFLHSNDDIRFQQGLDERSMLEARNVLNRSCVPVLDIAANSMLGRADTTKGFHPLEFQPRSMYLSAEAQNLRKDPENIVDTSPIELDKFLDMDTEIMGCHLKAILECWTWHPCDKEVVGPYGQINTMAHDCRHKQRRTMKEEARSESRHDRLQKKLGGFHYSARLYKPWFSTLVRCIFILIMCVSIASTILPCTSFGRAVQNRLVRFDSGSGTPASTPTATVATRSIPKSTSVAPPGAHSVAVLEGLFGMLPVRSQDEEQGNNHAPRRERRSAAATKKVVVENATTRKATRFRKGLPDPDGRDKSSEGGSETFGVAARMYLSTAFHEVRSGAANVSSECLWFMKNVTQTAYGSVEDGGIPLLEDIDVAGLLQLARSQSQLLLKGVQAEATYRLDRAQRNAKRLALKMKRGTTDAISRMMWGQMGQREDVELL